MGTKRQQVLEIEELNAYAIRLQITKVEYRELLLQFSFGLALTVEEAENRLLV